SITAENYAEYPLIILSHDGKKEIARVTADGNGNYRTALPPGDYVLDVQRRARGHVRAKPQRFTVVSDQPVRVDMDIETGVRWFGSLCRRSALLFCVDGLSQSPLLIRLPLCGRTCSTANT